MESILETILTNAGFAGALLAVCGWALWRKDRDVKELQASAVAREKGVSAKVEALTAEFTTKLAALADARTSDAQRVTSELMAMQERDADSKMALNQTLTQVRGVMSEIRQDVRRRSSRSYPSLSPDADEGG